MGFIRDALHDHQMSDPVRGTALVVDVNDWLLETRTPYTLKATLVVEADGVPKTTVEHSELVNASTGDHLDKWPEQGATIPVTVDRGDPTRVRIEWDELRGKADQLRETEREQNEARKQELLKQAYGTGSATTGAASTPPDPNAKVCASCQCANPAGNMFCRECGGLLA